ncbi:hypothetical protein ABZ667_41865 [Streptomyces lavendulae]|uniref:hypothetical protein n=1 Tax=Streptomyces lavendulae TaxID=1914 RepID=UPI003401D181
MSVVARELVAAAGYRRAGGTSGISPGVGAGRESGAVPGGAAPGAVPGGVAGRGAGDGGVLRLLSSLSQVPLGLLAFAQAFAVAWIVYPRTEAPPPQPGDHAWWHSAGPVEPEAFRPGLFLALATVAFYLTLPLLALAGQVLRRRCGRLVGAGGRSLPAQLGFAAAATAVGAVVTVPLVVLARAFSPVDGGPLGAVVTADAVTAMRLCALAALLLAFVAGAPWAAAAGAPSLRRESGSLHAESS